MWTRQPRDAALVVAWLAVNTIVFPKPNPVREPAWATRAILGEELWSSDRPKDIAAVVTGMTSLAAVVAIVAAARHRPWPAAVACMAQMALTLVYWELMARYWERNSTSAEASASSTGS